MKIIRLFGSLLFITLFLISTTFLFVFLSLVYPFNKIFKGKSRCLVLRNWSRVVMFLLKICCNLKYQITGIENIPKDKSVIFLSNHQSAWETLAFQSCLPHPLSFVAKRSVFFIPIVGWAYFFSGSFTINRKNSKKALVHLKKKGLQKIKAGFNIIIFPEGTRQTPGTIGDFKRGGGILAQYSQTQVIPIAHNSGEFWAKRTIIKKPGCVTVKIGKPIKVEGKTSKQITDETKKYIDKLLQDIG